VPAATAATAARAGACALGTEVTVVVDFGPLGGGTRAGCAAEASGSGTEVVTAAGFALTGVVSQPGFVCRVDGRPGPDAEDCRQTPPGDAYWGLFVADRAGAPWTYATVGLDSLEPAAGSFVGLRFQDGSARVPPGQETVAGAGPARDADAVTGNAEATAGGTVQPEQHGQREADGSGTTLAAAAAALVAGLLAATYVVARRRRAG
jgi:hypothetical protein